MTGLRIGGVCEGYGGLTMGVQAAVGGELAWYAEIEPAALAVLEHHHPGVPNHGDLTATDWSAVEPVDVFTAGWPCQPWSLAGQRKGASDERAIWPFVAGAVRVLRPRLVVLENVPAIVRAGELARVVTDLADLGYVGRWVRLRAADVGAAHGRGRVFVVAWPAAAAPHLRCERGGSARVGRDGLTNSDHSAPDPDRDPVRQQPVAVCGRGGASVAGRAGQAAADAEGDRRGQGRPEPARLVGGSDAAECDRADVDWGIYEPAIRRWERILGRPVPAPTVLNTRGGPQLSPYLDEWLMGLPAGHITGVPGLTVRQMLRLCGNGVMPLQAETAARWALEHAGASSEQAA